MRSIAATGRVAALMGLEGGHMIEDDLRVLRMFHRLGENTLRVMREVEAVAAR